MPKHDQTELPSIDDADLSEVTGGNHRPGHTSGSNAQITAALTSITDSIKNLNNQNTSGSSISQLLPMLMLAKGGAGGCPGGNCGR